MEDALIITGMVLTLFLCFIVGIIAVHWWKQRNS